MEGFFIMGMDGLFRPSQTFGYMDTLGHLGASEKADESNKLEHQVEQKERLAALSKDPNQRQNSDNPQQEPDRRKFEEQLKALLSEQFHIDLQADGAYRFDYNEQIDKIELIDMLTDKVLLTLTPEAFIQITQGMHRNSGVMTDRSA